MRAVSPSFDYGRRIPVRHTCDGDGTSPALRVLDVPSGTISLALLMEDPDFDGPSWVHWVLFDLPPDGEVPEGVEGLGVPGVNSWRRIGYGGPCPPTGVHRYLFRFFALDDTLRLPERSTAAEVRQAMEGHLLGEAVLLGRYGSNLGR